MTSNQSIFFILFPFLAIASECPNYFIDIDNGCYYKKHIDVLQDFIDMNESLNGLEPKNIGTQEWEEGKLTYLYLGNHLLTILPDSIGLLSNLSHLELQENKLTVLPKGICSLFLHHTQINLRNNYICPPYPFCLDYISQQNITSCETFECQDEYIEIDGECYYEEHIKVLLSIIENNESLNELTPLDLGREIGYLQWENGKLIILNLISNGLTNLPEYVCSIYAELRSFDVSNNAICPPYPSCFDYIGFQNALDCNKPDSCPVGYIDINEKCYYNKDFQVLVDLIKLNTEIKDYQPLMLGVQVWENGRLQQLNIEGLGISNLPESIQNLEHLEYLNLNNNKLEILPETLCNISPNLIWIDLSNNQLCPPYIKCFDYIGQQITNNCEPEYCPFEFKEYDDECYYQKDLEILQDFIDGNISLAGRKPLEIGVQKWKNMRLDFLYLGMNELTEIPESICEIYTNLSAINISRNKICPPYPECITEIVKEQDTSRCP